MVVMAEWMYYFWWLGTGFAVGVIAVLAWMYDRQRKTHKREMDAFEADHVDMETILSHPIPHTCLTPGWGSKNERGEWSHPTFGSHWLCVCGVRYVLTAVRHAGYDTPFRLNWVTEWEQRNGWRPAWDRQYRPKRPQHAADTLTTHHAAGAP